MAAARAGSMMRRLAWPYAVGGWVAALAGAVAAGGLLHPIARTAAR